MRTIAIGDVHGCYNELVDLISTLEEKGAYNKKTDKLVFLGDYIDRGDNSRMVIEYIRKLQKNNNNVIALMGNHEDMLLNFMDGVDDSWLFNGHRETIKSYKGVDDKFFDDVEWISNLPLYYEDEHCIYVHAGIDPYKPMDEQDAFTLLWVREPFIYDRKQYHKKVVFGHTPTVMINEGFMPIMTYAKNINIDTGCVYGGALTALIIDDGEFSGFFQTEKMNKNEKVNN